MLIVIKQLQQVDVLVLIKFVLNVTLYMLLMKRGHVNYLVRKILIAKLTDV